MENMNCPHCKKRVVKKDNLFWPFCSERCQLIDLGKWASGQYRIPGDTISKESEKEEEEEETPS